MQAEQKNQIGTKDRLLSVCIASIGRSSLLSTIEGVRACAIPAGFSVEMIIADDSQVKAVEILLVSLENRTGLNLVISAAKNISIARNMCMAHAAGEYIVFIDDDEVPDSQWLVNLVEIAEISGADAVQGNVLGVYPKSSPDWVSKVRPFDKAFGKTGEHLKLGSTCNLLFRRRALTARSLQFNTRYGKSGGEDTDFCYRLTSSGGVIVCSPTALVYEDVPPERLSWSNLFRRFARGGHTYAKVVLAGQGAIRTAIEICSAIFLILIFGILAGLSSLFLPAASARFTLRCAGNIGKLFFFFGLPAWNLY